MKILIDNESEAFRRLVTIQQDAECICEVIDLIIDGLKAYGFSESAIYNEIIEKGLDLQNLLEGGDNND